MKLHLAFFAGAAATLLALASPASAQYAYYQQPMGLPYMTRAGMGYAPDMCGPGFYCTNGCIWYGPSYCVYPPFQPFNGILPPMNNGGAFPVNPWTRSPRDFFMWGDAQRSSLTREVRPPF